MTSHKTNTLSVSIIIPGKNEEAGLAVILPKLKQLHPTAEIIVVDDGSSDNTASVCDQYSVVIAKHPSSKGNGAAVKSGARAATGSILVFLDADGQHRPEDIARLLERMNSGFDMVVGSRSASSQASLGRLAGNAFYNRLASWIVGEKVSDLTSGFRAVRADKFREFLYLLPNGFSYPTTITMAFFRAGYAVGYEPIETERRIGKSHIRPLRDAARFLLIIFKIGTLYAPLKIFLPTSLSFFLMAAGYYGYTYFTSGRFTNMSALLFVTSVLIFLIGLVSEQITALMYKPNR